MSRPDTIEVDGGTVEEAVQEALVALGARDGEVQVDVLVQPSRGLFGLGGRKARVRVTRLYANVTPAAPSPASPSPAAVDRAAPAAQLSPDLAAHAGVVLEDLMRRMGFASTVTVGAGEEGALLQIAGDNTNVLIGKHGQTLDALEYVLNRIVSREEEAATRIHVDCEQYRVKRQRSLEHLAQRMGAEAKRKGRSVTLEPMSPRDRRIIHLTLQNELGVTTKSSGDGYYRKLVIIPEGDRRRGRGRDR